MAAEGGAWLPPPLDRRPALKTPRLVLTPPRPADAADLVAAANDPDVVRWLARVPHPYTARDAAFFLDIVAPAECVYLARRRDTGALVGSIGLKPRPAGEGELGYWLARAEWGNGFATEAGRAIVALAFGPLGLGRLTATVVEHNTASARVLAKLGFVETGRSDRPVLFIGREAPHIELALERPTPAPAGVEAPDPGSA